MSLGSTLIFLALLATLAFTTVSLSISHLGLSKRLDNARIAANLSESAASEALAQILENNSWAQDVEITLASAPGGVGRVAFTSGKAREWQLPISTNNLKSPISVQGSTRVVPGETLHIISYGSYRGAIKRHEQIVAIPPYQYALVSTGKIESQGGLFVASVENPAVLANGVRNVPSELLRAGSLASNDDDPRAAIKLQSTAGEPNKIMGGLQSVGGIQVDDSTLVTGAVQPFADPAQIPTLDIAQYDPRERSDAHELTAPSQSHMRVQNPTRQQGPLSVSDGLYLEGGFLYVDGDLTVNGGVHGKGAIFCTGKLSISGVSTFAADDLEAIVAKGDISIQGSDRESSIFQGVLYSEGNLHAKDVTLVGTMLGNKPASAGSGSEIQLDHVNLIHNADVMNTVWSAGGDFDVSDPYHFGVMGMFTSGGSLFQSGPGKKADLAVVNRNKATDFYDAARDEFTLFPSDHRVEYRYDVKIPKYSDVAGMPTEYYTYDSKQTALGVLADTEHTESIQRAENIKDMLDNMLGGLGGFTMPNLGGMFGGSPPPPPPPPPPPLGTNDPLFLNSVSEDIDESISTHQMMKLWGAVGKFNDLYQQHHYSWMRQGAFGFSFDPNQFIQISDKARKVMWRELPDPGEKT